MNPNTNAAYMKNSPKRRKGIKMKKLLVMLVMLFALSMVGCEDNQTTDVITNEEVEYGDYATVYGDIAMVELIYDLTLAEYARGTLTVETINDMRDSLDNLDDGEGSGSIEFQAACYRTVVLLDYLESDLQEETPPIDDFTDNEEEMIRILRLYFSDTELVVVRGEIDFLEDIIKQFGSSDAFEDELLDMINEYGEYCYENPYISWEEWVSTVWEETIE